jgi:hypothetical protein
MIRKATMNDLPAIIDLSVESVSRDPLPVTIDRERMADTGKALIGNPAHFVWVAEDEQGVCACVAACVQPGFWFRGLQCSVLLYYARRPGQGVALLREFARWLKGRSGIKLAPFELEPGADPRILKVLHRLGFQRQSTNLTYVRSASCRV